MAASDNLVSGYSDVFLRLPLALTIAGCVPVLWSQEGVMHLLRKEPVKVTGIVVDSDGRPLPSIGIDHIAHVQNQNLVTVSVKTGPDGRFAFESFAPAVVFRGSGYVSQLLRFDADTPSRIIVLEGARAVPAIPTCAGSRHRYFSGAGLFLFPQIAGVRLQRRGHTIDTVEEGLICRRGKSRFMLIHGSGPSWGGRLPRDREVWASAEFAERTLHTNQLTVLDALGRTLDGKLWRSIGVHNESAFYFDVDRETALKFDAVMDGLCVAGR